MRTAGIFLFYAHVGTRRRANVTRVPRSDTHEIQITSMPFKFVPFRQRDL